MGPAVRKQRMSMALPVILPSPAMSLNAVLPAPRPKVDNQLALDELDLVVVTSMIII